MQTLGAENNCKGSWDTMLQVSDAGFKGIVRLAHRVFNSLAIDPYTEDEQEDIIQEALITLYENVDAWDTGKPFVSWASVVLRNAMISSMRKRTKMDEPQDPFSMEAISDTDPYTTVDDTELAWYLYHRADPKTQAALGKVMRNEPLTRNEYYLIEKYRELLSMEGYREKIA